MISSHASLVYSYRFGIHNEQMEQGKRFSIEIVTWLFVVMEEKTWREKQKETMNQSLDQKNKKSTETCKCNPFSITIRGLGVVCSWNEQGKERGKGADWPKSVDIDFETAVNEIRFLGGWRYWKKKKFVHNSYIEFEPPTYTMYKAAMPVCRFHERVVGIVRMHLFLVRKKSEPWRWWNK